MHYLDESHILLFLVQFFLLLLLARGLGKVFRHFKQPALETSDRASAIRELWEKALAFVPGLKAPDVEALLGREREFGTGLGAGIDWNAPDGEPAHFIFLLVTPEDQPSFPAVGRSLAGRRRRAFARRTPP